MLVFKIYKTGNVTRKRKKGERAGKKNSMSGNEQEMTRKQEVRKQIE